MRALAVLLLLGAAARAATLTAGPYVQQAGTGGFTVVFETDQPAHASVVVEGVNRDTEGTHHEARIDGLKPATRYAYQVILDGKPVDSAETRTLPARDPFTFVVYGDTRQGGAVEQAIAQRILGEAPDFAVHTGDLVRKGDDPIAWHDFFVDERELLPTVAVFPVLGNHEVWGDPAGEWARRFLPALRDRRYYAFEVAGSTFLVLDGNAYGQEQTRWLAGELERARSARHVFVFVHQPPFSLGDHCGSATEQLDWVALFERYRVRAVFAGHDHAYERMERNGVRYFVSGGGGAPLYDERPCAQPDRSAKRVYAQEYHFLKVRVVGDEVELTAERVEPGRPIESLRFGAKDPIVAEGPPLRSERSAAFALSWKYGAAALALLVIAGRLLRRRRRN
jgi:hypothetical protein